MRKLHHCIVTGGSHLRIALRNTRSHISLSRTIIGTVHWIGLLSILAGSTDTPPSLSRPNPQPLPIRPGALDNDLLRGTVVLVQRALPNRLANASDAASPTTCQVFRTKSTKKTVAGNSLSIASVRRRHIHPHILVLDLQMQVEVLLTRSALELAERRELEIARDHIGRPSRGIAEGEVGAGRAVEVDLDVVEGPRGRRASSGLSDDPQSREEERRKERLKGEACHWGGGWNKQRS